jgi:sec-independent protein translocase protein TatC
MITLDRYIDMMVTMLLAFGLCFQLPLVVMALVRVGIIDIAFLKRMRKYVYFSIAVIAALIIPDVVAGWFMLMIPLFGLYELGILLARRSQRAREQELEA